MRGDLCVTSLHITTAGQCHTSCLEKCRLPLTGTTAATTTRRPYRNDRHILGEHDSVSHAGAGASPEGMRPVWMTLWVRKKHSATKWALPAPGAACDT